MTDIDPRADIELHPADGQVTVRVPLAGPVTSQWLGCYQQLALASQVPAQARAHDDRAWIVVSVRASGNQADVVATLAFTLLLAMAVPLLLPARFSLGPRWAVPAVEALLLVAIVAIDRGRIDRRSAAGRALSLGE